MYVCKMLAQTVISVNSLFSFLFCADKHMTKFPSSRLRCSGFPTAYPSGKPANPGPPCLGASRVAHHPSTACSARPPPPGTAYLYNNSRINFPHVFLPNRPHNYPITILRFYYMHFPRFVNYILRFPNTFFRKSGSISLLLFPGPFSSVCPIQTPLLAMGKERKSVFSFFPADLNASRQALSG